MQGDVIFRKAAFGGFNRTDVISYIEQLKKENAALQSAVDEKNEKIEEYRKSNERLAEEAKKANEKIAGLEKQIEETKSECKKEKDLFKAQIETYEKQSPEEKIGAAMIDVRRYADLLLSETDEKIGVMSDRADEAAAKALTRILDVSSAIQTFSERLAGVFADIVKENDEICRELGNFKGSVKLPFDEARQQLDKMLE